MNKSNRSGTQSLVLEPEPARPAPAAVPAARPASLARRLRQAWQAAPAYLVLSLFLLLVILPIVMIFITAFKSRHEIARGVFALPEVWQWANFGRAWTQARFSNYFASSVIVAIAVVSVSTILALFTGYAFGQMRFPFKRFTFLLLLVGFMVPQEAFIIPLYHNLRAVGLLDTYSALILPQIGLSVSFGTFWLAGAFGEIPRDLIDAAKVDGCNSWTALWRVMLPMVQPAVLTLIVLLFVWTWNDFLLALVLVSSEELRTLPLGLAFFQGRYSADVPLVSAGAMIVALPTILVYFLFQRHFIRGITGGASKG